jgi:hypothetical protein
MNVLHQCVQKPTDEFECVFKVRETFYFCGGEFFIMDRCIWKLYQKYTNYDLNFVPFPLWNPNIKHDGYKQELQTVEIDLRIYEVKN